MRAALYARVSTEEQTEGYSIDAQRRAFQGLVDSRGWDIYREYVDEGKSARSEDINMRPMFKALINDALAGHFDVLVVHKLDRFSRNLRITLEYFDKLRKAGVDFVSINEQMDFTSPSGKVHLALLGAFAQYYSDNLSQETKKGWAERKKQGMYCGHLPFGAKKGDDGVPIPDPDAFPGLEMAFELAAHGKGDREISAALNEAGYRTTRAQGARLFSKETVGIILTNPFYSGYLSPGKNLSSKDPPIKAKHEPFIRPEIFDAVQNQRRKNIRSSHSHTTSGKTTYSLTGITWCWHCKEKGHPGRMHTACKTNGTVRLGCYNRAKGWPCPQKSVKLTVFEDQLRAYMDMFIIPEDYQQRILEVQKKLDSSYGREKEEKALTAKLERLQELYICGDIVKEKYEKQKAIIRAKLAQLAPVKAAVDAIPKLASLLSNVGKAWDIATDEQRSKLVRCLFQEIWVRDKEIVAVKPQTELEPFFQLNWDEFVKIMKLKLLGPSAPPFISPLPAKAAYSFGSI